MRSQVNAVRRMRCLLGLWLGLFVTTDCTRTNMAANQTLTPSPDLQKQLSLVATKRIFFGHQSVGINILDGVREILGDTPNAQLNIVHLADAQSIPPGPGVFESAIGHNGDPSSKNNEFLSVTAKGFDEGIALYKYCYVDVTASTTIPKVFEEYRQTIGWFRARHPLVKVVHVTIPLTTVEPDWKALLKSALGRETARDANKRRNEFNQLLKMTFRGEPIVDLAEVESTRPDGSRCLFKSGDTSVYSLCPEYSVDGGHLNELGRWRAAERLIETLAHPTL